MCSAAAHGKDWAIHELQQPVGPKIEWRPGQSHFLAIPDWKRLTGILDETITLVNGATTQFLIRSGVSDPMRKFREAMVEVARITPQQDGGVHVEKLAWRLRIGSNVIPPDE